MGGRGGKSGFSISAHIKSLSAKGQFPQVLMGTEAQRIEAFKTIDSVYSYPDDLKEYMQSRYANGIQKVRIHETEPGRLYASFDDKTIGLSYPLGGTEAETAKIKAGAEKFLFINHWNKR